MPATGGGPGRPFRTLPHPAHAAPVRVCYGANLRRLDPDDVFAPPRGQGITG